MIAFRNSRAEHPNPQVSEAPRRDGETNRQWLARVAGAADLCGQVLLVGGAGLGDFRVRVAQSHGRQDLTPGLWSHVALLGGPVAGAGGDHQLYEVSLEPPGGFGHVPKNNGVQEARLSRYDDPARYPNVALVRFREVSPADLDRAVGEFRRDRRLVDAGAQIVAWLGFIWGVGAQGNPLLGEVGVPSAAFVGQVFATLGMDLTPGSATQASSPEAIWQAARWWHDFYDRGPGGDAGDAPRGAFHLGQPAAACSAEC